MAWNSRPDYGSRDTRNSGRGGYSREPEDRSQQRFPNSGALFPTREKRTQNSPDLYGSVLIADEVLDYILREAQGGNEVLLELSAWMKISRDNTSITSIKINIPYKVRQEEEGNQTFRRPSYPNRGQPAYGRERDTRQEERDESRNSYREQSAGTSRGSGRPVGERSITEEFARGDRMPDFLRDDD